MKATQSSLPPHTSGSIGLIALLSISHRSIVVIEITSKASQDVHTQEVAM